MRIFVRVIRRGNRKLLDCIVEGKYETWRYTCRSINLYKLQLIPFPDYKLVASLEANIFQEESTFELYNIDNVDLEELFPDEYILHAYLRAV